MFVAHTNTKQTKALNVPRNTGDSVTWITIRIFNILFSKSKPKEKHTFKQVCVRYVFVCLCFHWIKKKIMAFWCPHFHFGWSGASIYTKNRISDGHWNERQKENYARNVHNFYLSFYLLLRSFVRSWPKPTHRHHTYTIAHINLWHNFVVVAQSQWNDFFLFIFVSSHLGGRKIATRNYFT